MRAPCRAAVAGRAGCRGIGDKADGRRLPVTVVEQIARDAGVTQWWIGKANREDVTWPVAELRQNAQGLGLLRKTKGTLARPLVPAPSQTIPASWWPRCSSDCRWQGLRGTGRVVPASRPGRGRVRPEPRHRRGADADPPRLEDPQRLRAHGLRCRPRRTLDARRSTLDAFESMAGGHRAADPALVTRLARATCWASPTRCESADPCRHPPGNQRGAPIRRGIAPWGEPPFPPPRTH